MYTKEHTYRSQHNTHIAHMAYDDSHTNKRPAVLVVHDWSGRNEFACEQANKLAALGYLGFAVDMYGDKRTGTTKEEKSALMQPLLDHRDDLQKRIVAALDAVIQQDIVEASCIAIIGYCFGGLCALDLARSGADIKGAISIHGSFVPPTDLTQQTIRAKILALHGYLDPIAPPEHINTFTEEMSRDNTDWQLHLYGQAYHSFSNPEANDAASGLLYNPVAATRSWQTMINFLQEIFNT